MSSLVNSDNGQDQHQLDMDALLSVRGILRTSFPLMIGTGIGAIQQCLDRLFLSYLSAEALAASFPAMITHYLICCFFIAGASYVGTFVSQHYGAKEWSMVGGMTWPAIFLAVGGSLLALALIPLLPWGFDFFHSEALVHQHMVDLSTWYCIGTLPTIMLAVWAAFFAGIGRVRLVMVLSVIAVTLNVLFNYALIFGHWGAPEMGVIGAAIGTVCAQSIVMVIYACLFFGKNNRSQFHILAKWRMGYQRLHIFLKFATPHGIREIIEVSSWHFLFLTVAHFGTVALAANNIVIGWYFMFFAPLMGLLQSVSISVGRLVGSERYDDVPRVLGLHISMGVVYAGVWLIAYVFFGAYMADPFIGTEGDPQQWADIKQQTIIVFIAAGIWGVFDAVQLLLRAGINAAGDVWWTFIATPIVYILSLVLPCAYLIHIAHQDIQHIAGMDLLMASWVVACFSLFVLCAVFYYRFRSGAWRHATVRVDS